MTVLKNDELSLDDLDAVPGGFDPVAIIRGCWDAVQTCAKDPLCDDIKGAQMPVKT